MGAPEGRAHRVKATMLFERRVPHKHAAGEPEGRNPVAERFGGAGCRGANGRAQLLEALPRMRRQRGKVGTHPNLGWFSGDHTPPNAPRVSCAAYTRRRDDDHRRA